MINVLYELSNLNGTSGDEVKIEEFIIKKVKQLGCRVSRDSMGNIFALKKGRNSQKCVMLSAHTDEVGMIVSSITEDGYAKFRCVGGIDESVLLAKKVTIGSNKVKGVTGVKAVHLMPKDKRKEKIKSEDMYIDIGVSSKQEAEKLIKKGDYIYFDTNACSFGNNYAKGKAFDDRCGCYILLELMKEEYDNDIYFCFTVQEEIGLRGSSCASRRIKPDEAIVIECTTCLDMPKVEEKDISTRTGKGGAITIVDSATYADKELRQRLADSSEKFQYKNLAAGGNDAGAISINNIKTAAISVPARYIHSPVSVISTEDVSSVITTVKNFLKGEENA